MKTAAVREQVDIVDSKRWLAYATAGAAGALVCQGTEASIIHVAVNQVLDVSGGPGTNTSVAAFSVGENSGASIFFTHFANTNAGAAFFAASGAGSGAFRGFFAAGYPYASNLAAGQNVSTGAFLSGTGTMAFASGFGNSEFLGSGIGFIGFRFDEGLGDGTQYGWARVDMSGAPVNSLRIVDYAFTTAGENISAGQVPEPSSLGLLAAGAAGLAAARRRKRRKAS